MRRLMPFVLAVGAALLVLAGLGLSLYLWSGTDRSLATTLDLAGRMLPADQSLDAGEVEGSLRSGGRIGWLRWRQGALSVEARDAEVAWSLAGLLDGQLRLDRLAIARLRIEDKRAPTPATPPPELTLPIRVEAPFEVTTLEWIGSPPLVVNGLAGRYTFDSKIHRIDAGKARISSGNYDFSGELEAAGAMALAVRLQGEVVTTPPGSPRTVTLVANAQAQGALAGMDATLELSAGLAPRDLAAPITRRPATPGSALASTPMQATVTARIQPWQPQPVAGAQGDWQGLDLAALWPQAPRTLLRGQATVMPRADGWLAQADLSNALPGPWDRQQLPLDQLKARARYAGGQWIIESLDAVAAGGRILAQAQSVPTASNPPKGTEAPALAWDARATLQRVNPAAADSRLAAASLNGQLTARIARQAWTFDADLTGAPLPGGPPGASAIRQRLKALRAQGRWEGGTLTLPALLLQTDDTQLQGSLTFHLERRSGDARLNLSLPGGTVTLAGQISESQGAGALAAQVTDASLAARWLASWPGMPTQWAQGTVRGSAALNATWKGGWKEQGRQLQVQAQLAVPRLDLGAPGAAPTQVWQVSDGQFDLTGTLASLRLNTRGRAQAGTRRLELAAAAQAGHLGDGAWRAQVETLQLKAQDSLQPGTWTLRLGQRVAVDWKDTPLSRALQVSAGDLRLTGPQPGEARIEWQPASWSRRDAAPAEWRSQGRVQGLPLGWIDRLAGLALSEYDLAEDMVLAGQWDLAVGAAMRLRASLERTQGDFKMQLDDGGTSVIDAGVRTARIDLTGDNGDLDLRAAWDSQRAGEAQARFRSRLQRQSDGWTWPADAAVSGSLRAQLPRLRAWSALTPPGWRIRGTLQADATLAGTRAAPQWGGTIAADNLAARSIVDGIEFSQGRLRATLQEQRVDITEFSLQGASGAQGSGGQLSLKGFALWPSARENTAAGVKGVRMELEAQADALRVSARADRRLTVSGKLTAKLADARLVVRGGIKADQALIILPEETASGLGSDVVVSTRNGKGTLGATVTAAPPSAAPPSDPARPGVEQDVAVTLDLGPDFQVRGYGLKTRLAGSLTATSKTRGAPQPRLTGEISTVGGTYKAYGQWLDIDEGVLRFSGAYDNPALDILAIRPNLTQRVGVQITGTALSPRVRLYSDPVLSEAETLSWLLLGRSGANGGAEAAMLQQAALAILGGSSNGLSGQLTEALGLDELSVRAPGESPDGNATGATVMVGKRLARNFYVAYEQSLSGAMGTFQIFYELTSRLTLRAQIGQQSVVDLIYTVRFDNGRDALTREPPPRQLQSSPKPP
jgi:translocation and assembly module TamB